MRTDGRKRTPSTRSNARVIAVIVMALTVVLAGCTGLGGLSGSGGDGATATSDGDSGGSERGATAADSSNRGSSGGGNGSGNADSASASNGGGKSASSGGSPNGDGATAAKSLGDSSGSSDGASGSSGSALLNAEEDWFNLSKPGKYVFEIESAEEGTGKMSFETTEVSGGQATTKATYELGDDSFASTVTGPVGEVQPQLATSPAYTYLLAIQLGGIGAGALSGGEDLEVGNKFSQQSSQGSMDIEVTGTDSYAGVDCYVVETRINGTLNQQVCTQQAFSSVPYFVTYDENGDLVQRVELVEYERR